MRLQEIPRRKNIISLTPLIDIVFILLVFFMLTSSFNRQTSLDLQQAESSQATSDVQNYRVLTVTGEGLLLEDKTLITPENLDVWVNSAIKDGDDIMVLTADDSAVVQQLMVVLETLKPVLGDRLSLASVSDEVEEP